MRLDSDRYKAETISCQKENDRIIGASWIMTKKLDRFISLTRQAAIEDVPRVDVRGKVLASIAASKASAYADQLAFRFLFGSVSLAFVALVLVSILASLEPPLEMVTPFVSSLP